jgi:hypothetical protein
VAADLSASAKEAKRKMMHWIRLVTQQERYYFAKAMDLFYQIPSEYQKAMIEFFAERESNNKWLEKVDDDTQYRDVIRSILFYYSGSEDAGQPNKRQFITSLAELIKSERFKTIEESATADVFSEELDRI